MDESILKIEDLNISFRDEAGWHRVVENISFSLLPGQSLGIVGESGSGKSVTSLSIMRLLPAMGSRVDSGSITFKNSEDSSISIIDMDESGMRKLRGSRIAMVFQGPMTSLNPVMKCGRQLTESIRMHLGMNMKKAREHTPVLIF